MWWLWAFACGEGTDEGQDATEGEAECGFERSFSGSLDVDPLVIPEDHGCSSSPFEDRVAFAFGLGEAVGAEEAPFWISLEVSSGVVPGTESLDLPATLEVVDPVLGSYDGWRTATDGCTVSLTTWVEHEFWDYIVSGTGTCAGPATPDGDAPVKGNVTVGPFSFVAPY